MIVGHSATTGDAKKNLQLSYARALAARTWMQRMVIFPTPVSLCTWAVRSQPIVSGDAVSGRAINRRVDIHLVPHVEACMNAVG
ncbi:OmpA family protein [Pseudomonas synxantha]|uniref:OmpA family protein n=1 Tax=Pseudomonas synxantha TaxID=47883 RepID=UPI001F1565D0|nr:OmpA family protein [Pseudomonas synxantha]